MDTEKILTLVAIVVYGLFNIVLSVVRTLKTSRISSEVKAILPSIDDGKPIDDGESIDDDGKSIDDGKPIDGGESIDDGQLITLDELLSIVSQVLNRRR